MRENALLAPHRVGRTEAMAHDGTIIIRSLVNTAMSVRTVEQSRQRIERVLAHVQTRISSEMI
jgi:hypothetical protein